MNKLQINNLIKPLLEIYDEIEIEIIKQIIEMVDNYDGVKGSLEWYIKKLEELGTFDKKTLKIIKSGKKDIKEVIKKLLENRVNGIDYIQELDKAYQQGIINKEPINLFNSVGLNLIINNAVSDVNDILDLIDSKVLESANKEYKNILNKAYVETASGVYTYTEAIRRAINDLSSKGIIVGHYSNNRSMSIESIVRRDVITRTNKLEGETVIEHCKILETNLVYVDQHLGARTRTPYMKESFEAHAEWQGKVYMIEGSSKKYFNLYEVTGFGKMLGLYGINCYHHMRPFFEGMSIPETLDEKENKRIEELNNRQRKLERKICEYKRLKSTTIDEEDKKKYSKKLNKYLVDIDEFTKNNNLRRDYSREYISPNINGGLGINESITENDIYKTKVLELGKIDMNMKDETIKYYEKVLSQQKVENAIIIQNDGEVVRCIGSKYGVGIYGDLKNAIITHNHVTIDEEIGGSFGKDDWTFIVNNYKKNLMLRAVDEKYVYKVRVLKDITLNDYQNSYINAKLIDDDFKHCVMKDLMEKGLIEYERTIRK